MNGLISVIIPVYNVERYLRECVDSVLGQTYQNFEIILVDDGSTDSSGDICDEYAKEDKRIQVVHQKNGGLSDARNKGFSKSSGEYVYFLDSDDWILPNAFMDLFNKARQENADVVFFDAASFVDGSAESKIEQRYLRKYAYETADGYSVLGRLQENKEYHSAVTLLFIKKESMESAEVLFESGIVYEDMIFTYELFAKATQVTQLNQTLYQRRYRSDSIMTSKRTKKNYLSAGVVYKKVRNVSSELKKLDDKTAQDYIVRCAFNALNLYKELNREERIECKKDYQELKKDILANNAYGNKALHMRCYGAAPWFCYKVYEKVFLTGLKGKK